MGVWLLNFTPVPTRQNQVFYIFLNTQSGVKTIEYFHCTCRITCGITSSDSKLLDTKICRTCQAKWLLTFNATKRRHQTLLQEIKALKDLPEISSARTSYQKKKRIVDPTLIHPTTTPKKRERNSTNRLSEATGNNNNLIEINDDTPTY